MRGLNSTVNIGRRVIKKRSLMEEVMDNEWRESDDALCEAFVLIGMMMMGLPIQIT